MSPMDQTWPPCAKMHTETHKQLKIIFQKWRVSFNQSIYRSINQYLFISTKNITKTNLQNKILKYRVEGVQRKAKAFHCWTPIHKTTKDNRKIKIRSWVKQTNTRSDTITKTATQHNEWMDAYNLLYTKTFHHLKWILYHQTKLSGLSLATVFNPINPLSNQLPLRFSWPNPQHNLVSWIINIQLSCFASCIAKVILPDCTKLTDWWDSNNRPNFVNISPPVCLLEYTWSREEWIVCPILFLLDKYLSWEIVQYLENKRGQYSLSDAFDLISGSKFREDIYPNI